jgi:hypothetical protein
MKKLGDMINAWLDRNSAQAVFFTSQEVSFIVGQYIAADIEYPLFINICQKAILQSDDPEDYTLLTFRERQFLRDHLPSCEMTDIILKKITPCQQPATC